MYPRSGVRYRGTSAKTTLFKTFGNHPFANPRECFRRFSRGSPSQGEVTQLLAGTDAGMGVRGHVRVWGAFCCSAPQYGWGQGGKGGHTHTHTHRNVHANVAPTF